MEEWAEGVLRSLGEGGQASTGSTEVTQGPRLSILLGRLLRRMDKAVGLH